MLSNMGHMRHDLHHGTLNKYRPTHAGISHGKKLSELQKITGAQKLLKNSPFQKLSNSEYYTNAHRGDSHIKLVPTKQKNAKHIHRSLKAQPTPSREISPMAFRFGFGPKVSFTEKRGRPRWIPKIKE